MRGHGTANINVNENINTTKLTVNTSINQGRYFIPLENIQQEPLENDPYIKAISRYNKEVEIWAHFNKPGTKQPEDFHYYPNYPEPIKTSLLYALKIAKEEKKSSITVYYLSIDSCSLAGIFPKINIAPVSTTQTQMSNTTHELIQNIKRIRSDYVNKVRVEKRRGDREYDNLQIDTVFSSDPLSEREAINSCKEACGKLGIEHAIHLRKHQAILFENKGLCFSFQYGKKPDLTLLDIKFDIDDGFLFGKDNYNAKRNTNTNQFSLLGALNYYFKKWKNTNYFGDLFPKTLNLDFKFVPCPLRDAVNLFNDNIYLDLFDALLTQIEIETKDRPKFNYPNLFNTEIRGLYKEFNNYDNFKENEIKAFHRAITNAKNALNNEARNKIISSFLTKNPKVLDSITLHFQDLINNKEDIEKTWIPALSKDQQSTQDEIQNIINQLKTDLEFYIELAECLLFNENGNSGKRKDCYDALENLFPDEKTRKSFLHALGGVDKFDDSLQKDKMSKMPNKANEVKIREILKNPGLHQQFRTLFEKTKALSSSEKNEFRVELKTINDNRLSELIENRREKIVKNLSANSIWKPIPKPSQPLKQRHQRHDDRTIICK